MMRPTDSSEVRALSASVGRVLDGTNSFRWLKMTLAEALVAFADEGTQMHIGGSSRRGGSRLHQLNT